MGGGLVGGGGLRGRPGGTPTYKPQNDPHDALIILNIHKWGKKFPPISSGLPVAKVCLGGQVAGPNFFSCFPPIFEFSTKI